MSGRFEAPQLLDLGAPPRLASSPFEDLLAAAKARLIEGMAAISITYDVGALETDPAIVIAQEGVYRDMLRRFAIDDAVAQTCLGSDTFEMLDQRAADYGVLRQVVQPADPVEGTPAVYEDDESLRMRARLAWEALSVAGPAGAYVFHAIDANPDVLDAAAYGPETGFVQPGEVLVVVQSRGNQGIPTPGLLDVIAQRLDAYQVDYADATSLIRPVRDEQSVRPLGARVTVAAAQPLVYNTTATLFVRPDGDRDLILAEARRRLGTYQEMRRRVGTRVTREAREAVLSLADANGLPILDKVRVVEDDVVPNHRQLPVSGVVTLTAIVR